YISLDDFRIIKNQIIKGKYNSVKKRQPFATTVFITPPYARIGMNETEAKEQGLDFSVYMLSADHIPKAAILREERGILKTIVDNESGKILGCMLYCAEAHEMINTIDRKSTRLNSSHVKISYAVFCLKKKKHKK